MDSDKTININITGATIFKFFLISLLLFSVYYLSEIVLALLTSIVIASALEPFIFWFTEKKVPRVLAVIAMYVFLFATVFLLFSIFLPLIFDDFLKLLNSFPSLIMSFDVFSYISDSSSQILNSIKNSIANSFSVGELIPGLSNLLTGKTDSLLDTAKSFFGSLFSLGFIIVFSFYLAVQEKGIEIFLRLATPLKYEKYIIDLWGRSKKKIGLWLQGQILLGVLIGVFAFLGLSVLGIRYALALAVLAAIFEIIPVFGPILAAFPAVILAFLQEPRLGFLTLALYVIMQQFENHLIYPLVVRKVVGIPPLLSILFLIIGAKMAGFLGIVLSIPAAVLIMELAEDFEKKKRFSPAPIAN